MKSVEPNFVFRNLGALLIRGFIMTSMGLLRVFQVVYKGPSDSRRVSDELETAQVQKGTIEGHLVTMFC